MCKSKWDDAWDRADDQGIFTMDQCCEMADEADPDHDYGSSEPVDDPEENSEETEEESDEESNEDSEEGES